MFPGVLESSHTACFRTPVHFDRLVTPATVGIENPGFTVLFVVTHQVFHFRHHLHAFFRRDVWMPESWSVVMLHKVGMVGADLVRLRCRVVLVFLDDVIHVGEELKVLRLFLVLFQVIIHEPRRRIELRARPYRGHVGTITTRRDGLGTA